MRLGAPILEQTNSPDQWIRALRSRGYSAAICPLTPQADDHTVAAYREAARDAGILIAEVGAWSNCIAMNEEVRRAAVRKNIDALHLAERIGARVCVNIAGSRSDQWDGPHPDNISEDTFHLIVETVRHIIDTVQPTRTFYCLEMMPHTLPDSPQSYLRFIQAIDRRQFAVHLDPVNIVNSPRACYHTADLLCDCFNTLGPHIQSCHAKDIALRSNLTVHLDEVPPGHGSLDYPEYLRLLNQLHPDTPLIIEHLRTEQDYHLAANHIRSTARQHNIPIH